MPYLTYPLVKKFVCMQNNKNCVNCLIRRINSINFLVDRKINFMKYALAIWKIKKNITYCPRKNFDKFEHLALLTNTKKKFKRDKIQYWWHFDIQQYFCYGISNFNFHKNIFLSTCSDTFFKEIFHSVTLEPKFGEIWENWFMWRNIDRYKGTIILKSNAS